MVATLYGATCLTGLLVNWAERGKMSLNDALDETFGDLKAEMVKMGVNLPDIDEPIEFADVITP